MWIKQLPKGRVAVMPDGAIFDTIGLANDYMATTPKQNNNAKNDKKDRKNNR